MFFQYPYIVRIFGTYCDIEEMFAKGFGGPGVQSRLAQDKALLLAMAGDNRC